MMQFLNTIASMVAPRAGKAATTASLEKAATEAEKAALAAARDLRELEGGLAEAVLKGATAHDAHRAKTADARARLDAAEAAHAAVKDRLRDAHAAAAEQSRRDARDRAHAAQQDAAAAILAEYPTARDAILRLQRLAAEADDLAAAANADLPVGAEPLPRETESLIRDIPGHHREVLSSTKVDLWVGEGGAPVADQNAVKSRDGRTGTTTVETGFGTRALPVHRQKFEKRRVRLWAGPVYGARLADIDLPPLRPDAPPAAAEVEELIPVSTPALAAE